MAHSAEYMREYRRKNPAYAENSRQRLYARRAAAQRVAERYPKVYERFLFDELRMRGLV